jgi:hypothetical protein
MMKIAIVLLVALFALICAERMSIVVQVKDVRDAPKLLEFALANSLNFDSVLPPTKTPRAKSEALDRLARYFYSPIDSEKTEIQATLLSLEWIEAAWIHGESSLPAHVQPRESTESTETSQNPTPNFQERQFYLNKAPVGVDMAEMFNRPNGRGEGVTIVDLEGGWDFDHEDLKEHNGRIIFGHDSGIAGWRDHGSAVLGEMAGSYNGFGVTGIASKAKIFASSIYDERGQQASVARAIVGAADFLKKGDMLLIELHRGGPRGAFIAMEWWPDNFDALKYATEKGIIVFEAAGNGAQSLDHPDYNRPQPGFPTTWRNPFNRTLADCGAILCGAGAPNTGRWGPDRSRLDFSNYGNSLDAAGIGRDVVTLGYGDLQRIAGTRTRLYTAQFSGTSSASPIVVGAAAAIQGFAKSHNIQLGPKEWRQLLRSTGSPQTDAPGRPIAQRIGNRPDLHALRLRVKEMIKARKAAKKLLTPIGL